jgi:polyketide cyclase/dehydrase/lipid transport protein
MIHRVVSQTVPAGVERCAEILLAVEDYPRWYDLLSSVEPLPDGRVVLRAHVLGLHAVMTCSLLRTAEGVTLRRLPNDASDSERYEAAWMLAPAGPGSTAVTLALTAALAVPGPAALLRKRVERRLTDDLLAAFVARVA